MYCKAFVLTISVMLSGLLATSQAAAQADLFKSQLGPTGLGSTPEIAGVPADPFAWDLSSGKAVIKTNGDLTEKAEDLLILDTDGIDPGVEGTNGGFDFFASLACGGVVVGNGVPVTPDAGGKIEILELDLRNSVGVTDCPGAQIILRVGTGAAGAAKNFLVTWDITDTVDFLNPDPVPDLPGVQIEDLVTATVTHNANALGSELAAKLSLGWAGSGIGKC